MPGTEGTFVRVRDAIKKAAPADLPMPGAFRMAGEEKKAAAPAEAEAEAPVETAAEAVAETAAETAAPETAAEETPAAEDAGAETPKEGEE